MSGFEPRQNNRGNFACPYCKHKAWKTKAPVVKHIHANHEQEAVANQQKAEADERIHQANIAKYQAENRAIRAERELAEIKNKKTVVKRYSAVVYCPTCLSVDSVSIVKGQTIGVGGCFRCGTLGVQLVEHVNVNAGSYKIVEES